MRVLINWFDVQFQGRFPWWPKDGTDTMNLEEGRFHTAICPTNLRQNSCFVANRALPRYERLLGEGQE